MALPDEYLQDLIESKDTEAALSTGKDLSWSICDGAMVIYDLNDPPDWVPRDHERDEDGNTVSYAR